MIRVLHQLATFLAATLFGAITLAYDTGGLTLLVVVGCGGYAMAWHDWEARAEKVRSERGMADEHG